MYDEVQATKGTGFDPFARNEDVDIESFAVSGFYV